MGCNSHNRLKKSFLSSIRFNTVQCEPLALRRSALSLLFGIFSHSKSLRSGERISSNTIALSYASASPFRATSIRLYSIFSRFHRAKVRNPPIAMTMVIVMPTIVRSWVQPKIHCSFMSKPFPDARYFLRYPKFSKIIWVHHFEYHKSADSDLG